MTTVKILNGKYRGKTVQGASFTLLKGYRALTTGGEVTVASNGFFGPRFGRVRIRVSGPDKVEFSGEDAKHQVGMLTAKNTPVSPETDQQVMERIRERFEILDNMTKAIVEGNIRAMVVSGPPGVGKSYGVERIIEKATLFDQLAGRKLKAEVIKGAATPIGLYQALWKYSDPNCVVVFDDCDSILLDDQSLNLLKGALDSSKRRRISWLSESRVLRAEGIPDSFDFKGSVIFITNLKFDKMKSQKLRDHLDALQSRCHYLDLTLDTMRDKVLRIRQIAKDGALFEDMGLDKIAEDEIVNFVDDNRDQLREVSLRMAIKVAQLRKGFSQNWKTMARATCMRPAHCD